MVSRPGGRDTAERSLLDQSERYQDAAARPRHCKVRGKREFKGDRAAGGAGDTEADRVDPPVHPEGRPEQQRGDPPAPSRDGPTNHSTCKN
ncbi:hypothetical protein GCM10012320_01810 [Sinomonas cellulolyticus]|nr:hypothetical protein GCM10012320_01810 [Sinomonas sp. KCTC 49339]